MPYITKNRRDYLDTRLADTSIGPPSQTAGELNFEITTLLLGYLETKGLSYQTINDIVGALEGAKLEFYARVARPYEDTKIQQNGDVY